jgi:hypothetical protein
MEVKIALGVCKMAALNQPLKKDSKNKQIRPIRAVFATFCSRISIKTARLSR